MPAASEDALPASVHVRQGEDLTPPRSALTPLPTSRRALLEQVWESRDGCLSVQVLQEFFVTVTGKIARPLDPEAAEEIVADVSRWFVHAPAADDVLAAIGIHQRTGISFWDAMLVRSAAEIGCATLYSEDLSAGQDCNGARAENPFQPPDASRE